MLSSGLRIPPLLLLLLTAMELSWSLIEEDKKLIVDLHNQYRSKVSPPAADMLKMSWDPELETFAKDYATKCIWEHNKERGWRGENLFAMTGDLTVKTAVEDWYNEYQHYNMTTLTCAEGEMCGHYTQVVWASSKRVGCGTEFCKTLEVLNETDMHLLVCNYEPPGNVKGRKPYEEGSPCSMCPDGYSCEDSLCVSSGDLEGTTASPGPTGLEPTAIMTTSPKSISITTGPASATSESPQPLTEAETEFPTTKGPASSLEPTSDLGLRTSPELQTKGTEAAFATGFTPHTNLDPTPASPETETTQVSYSELPSSDDLITSEASMKNVEQPPSTEPVHSSPKALPTTKLPPTPKRPSPSKLPSPHKPPSHPKPAYHKPPPPLKHTPISKSPASYRLAAYSKAIKRLNHVAQSSLGKTAHISVCLPCLGCKQISQPEEIKTALKELTFTNPNTSCFSPLPRWRRHSKCRWCGRTWSHALTRASPYWLKSL
ncbi:peptidase inhibitor 16 [Heteronotia binoei]|uniref:peptidase inhibitor 16 n=1 Tax=Heteronotia binoei TaxID=13085 RepID=UPI00292ED769|nr:peptidase inhibitor 16 [Heteronotia binoei]XP_060087504.1 peptidase inhibitor 16 [Heteronotia binoei]XP_060087505.1 peptidase inhibitor 16 [Heteronotia binoei]